MVTTWEWGTEKTYMHDLISSDRRNPTVNAHGPLFGSPEYASDNMPILDPKTSTVTFFKLPVRDSNMLEAPGFGFTLHSMQPSAYWGDEKIWNTKANNHNAMFDKKGRYGWRHLCAAWTTQLFAKKAPTILRPGCFRSTNHLGKQRSSIRKQ